jgi:hypothetical protein
MPQLEVTLPPAPALDRNAVPERVADVRLAPEVEQLLPAAVRRREPSFDDLVRGPARHRGQDGGARRRSPLARLLGGGGRRAARR